MPTIPGTAPKSRAHLSSKSDDWPTPQDFYDYLDAEFGGFVLDLCASTTNHKADSYYALDHSDAQRRDGLAADWAAEAARLGGPAWLNPPYGTGIEAWMAKAHEAAQAGATVVALVPVRTSSAWFHDHVFATVAEVRWVLGRLTFGDAKNTAAFASAVIIYRPTHVAGAPGPVSTMRAHPGVYRDFARVEQPSRSLPTTPEVAQTVPRSGADTRSARRFAPGLDCINSRTQTARTLEHLFDCRGRVETADPSPALPGKSGTRPAERTMPHTAAPARHGAAQSTPGYDSRLDVLTTRVVATVFRTLGTAGVAALDPTDCLSVARSAVAAHGGLGRSYRHEAAVQHLFATAWNYAQHFAPRAGWQLTAADPAAAQLRWRADDPALPAVLDVLTTTGHRGLPTPGAEQGHTAQRLCNLTDLGQSLLRLPDSTRPLPWSASNDPMHARELVGA